jgi:hypothetical protein
MQKQHAGLLSALHARVKPLAKASKLLECADKRPRFGFPSILLIPYPKRRRAPLVAALQMEFFSRPLEPCDCKFEPSKRDLWSLNRPVRLDWHSYQRYIQVRRKRSSLTQFSNCGRDVDEVAQFR